MTEAHKPDLPADATVGLRMRMKVGYVGTAFHGWQIQKEHRTVQGVLRDQVSRLLGRQVIPMGAGRTDAGVHARGQVAHVRVNTLAEAERLIRALPGLMPADVALSDLRLAEPDFNARFSAIARRYSYLLFLKKDIFQPYCWQIPFHLERAAMTRAAADIPGSRDCASFCKTASLKGDGNVCHIDVCKLEWAADSAIFHIRANRFLHHMVRILMGTLVEVGRGHRPADCLPAVFEACDRSQAGLMAPAAGLFLEEVYYPGDLDETLEGEDP